MEESSKLSFSILKKQLASDGEKMNLDNLPDYLTPKKVFVAILLKHVNQAVEQQSKNKLPKLDQSTAEKACDLVFERARYWDHAVEPIVVEDITKWIDIFEPIKQLKNLKKIATNILNEYNAAFTQKYHGYIFPCDGFILVAKVYLDILKKRNPGEPIHIHRALSRYLVLALMLYGKSQTDLSITSHVHCGLAKEEYTDSFTHKPVKNFKEFLKENEQFYAFTLEQDEVNNKQVIVHTFTELTKKLADPTNKNLNEDEWKVLKKFAEDGEVSSQTFLGMNYYDGKSGLPRDFKQAFHWLTKAAERKQPRAQYYLGRYYSEGDAIKKDFKQAFDWLKKAAEQKDSQAQLALGVWFATGTGVLKDLKRAVHWYQQAAEQNNSHAQNALAICYADGEGISKDLKKAAYWYEQAAKQGNLKAQFSLAMCYLEGKGVSKEVKRAFSIFEAAAKAGEPHCQYMMVTFYKKGEGVAKDDQQAAVWLEKSATNGFAEAQNTLGLFYLNGEGVSQDIVKAAFWFEKAASQGHAGAKEYFSQIVTAVEGYKTEAKKTQFGPTSAALHKQPAVAPYPEERKENKEEEDEAPHP